MSVIRASVEIGLPTTILMSLTDFAIRNGMKWKTHVGIARAICEQIEIPAQLEDLLIRGSVGPDELRNEFIDVHGVPHHSMDHRYIEELLAMAERAYEENRPETATYLLGSALHLLQDRCVSATSRRTHERMEARIARVEIKASWVRKGMRASPRSWRGLRRQIGRAREGRSPRRSVRRATILSASAVAYVLRR